MEKKYLLIGIAVILILLFFKPISNYFGIYDVNLDKELHILFTPQGIEKTCPLYPDCLGDLNSDETIDEADNTILMQHWLGNCDYNNDFCNGADFTCDGKVNMEDFAIISQNIGKICYIPCPLYPDCLGDLNSDKIVNDADKDIWQSQWLKTCNEENNHCEGADFTCDGKVNMEDFSILSEHYLVNCNPQPETGGGGGGGGGGFHHPEPESVGNLTIDEEEPPVENVNKYIPWIILLIILGVIIYKNKNGK